MAEKARTHGNSIQKKEEKEMILQFLNDPIDLMSAEYLILCYWENRHLNTGVELAVA